LTHTVSRIKKEGVVASMDWNYAQIKINTNVKIGTDINTASSTYRKIVSVNAIANSARYGYRNEIGFTVSIGQSVKINIPWSMLKECFSQLNSVDGYNGAFFRKRFPIQAKDHPCHVHVVGQIFVAAGFADIEDGSYRIRKDD
jgi:hypothetical protein